MAPVKKLGVKYAKKDVIELKNIFDEHDKNRDGYVSVREFKDALAADLKHSYMLGAELASFRVLDLNHDNQLTFDEYLRRLFPLANAAELKTMLAWASPAPGIQKQASFKLDTQQLEDLRKMFAMYDRDRSGTISAQELCKVAEGCGYSRDEFEALFKASDTDHSGSLSFDEFVNLMEEAFL